LGRLTSAWVVSAPQSRRRSVVFFMMAESF
jgi:hypothetical protein